MQDIKELSLEELEVILKNWNEPVFHAQHFFSWIYKKGACDFDAMSDLSQELRARLKENFYLFGLKLVKILKSQDGTNKFLFELKDKNFTPPFLISKRPSGVERAGFIEAVTIPTQTRLTGCISTQVGCKFACRFCASAVSGFKRNLTVGEMLEEVLQLKNNSYDKKLTPLEVSRQRRLSCQRQGLLTGLTHLVFMGTGEPLDNYDNVIKAIRIINSPYAFNIGARRITISTCGIIPAIKRLSDEQLQIELSISLHASDDKTRSLLMPINKKYPLKDLIQAAEEYIKKTNRQITFEYVLIKNINSDLQSALNLSNILRPLKLCKVNLIPANPVRNTEALERQNKISNGANPVKELKVEPPNKLEILLFRDYLIKSGINVTLRKPRGQDIEAACGQLRLRYEKSQITQI